MSNVVKRENPNQFQVILSANTPDFPPVDWVINPVNLPVLIGNGNSINPQVPKKYWIIDPVGSSNLREMTAQEKALVDGDPQEVIDARAERQALLQQATDDFLVSRYDEGTTRHFLALRWTAVGPQLTDLNNWLNWYRTVITGLNTQLTALAAAKTVTDVTAVTFDPTVFIATDPGAKLTSA